jgi:hypothetical protein
MAKSERQRLKRKLKQKAVRLGQAQAIGDNVWTQMPPVPVPDHRHQEPEYSPLYLRSVYRLVARNPPEACPNGPLARRGASRVMAPRVNRIPVKASSTAWPLHALESRLGSATNELRPWPASPPGGRWLRTGPGPGPDARLGCVGHTWYSGRLTLGAGGPVR